MKALIPRKDELCILQKLIRSTPVTAILGARQCGKTTLANQLQSDAFFDLENPRDARQFETPQLTLERLKGLIVIDEIQHAPEIFPLLRYLVDHRPDHKYLILGSASRDLIRQSSESLAGRIAYHNLGGLRFSDLPSAQLERHWLRGGFPRSFTAQAEEESYTWRMNFIQTFLERDIPQLGIAIAARTLRRFWIMLSHYHGQILNHSELARSFGISDKTVRHYIDILEGTFMIRVMQPWFTNPSKRLVKSPKLYLRDSGIFHALQSIGDNEQLLTHNKLGASWEGYIVEEISKIIATDSMYFYRTHNGSEVDLFWQSGGRNWGVEVKYGDSPGMSRSLANAAHDLELEHLWIVYPGRQEYPVTEKATVIPLERLRERIFERCQY